MTCSVLILPVSSIRCNRAGSGRPRAERAARHRQAEQQQRVAVVPATSDRLGGLLHEGWLLRVRCRRRVL